MGVTRGRSENLNETEGLVHGLDLTWNSTPAFRRNGISNQKPLECVLAWMVDEAITTAAARLGYPTVLSEQRDVVRAIVTGKDVKFLSACRQDTVNRSVTPCSQ